MASYNTNFIATLDSSTGIQHVNPDTNGGSAFQNSTVVRQNSTGETSATNQQFHHTDTVITENFEKSINGKKNSVKRPSEINLDQEFPPRYSETIDGDATFYSPPSYKTDLNNRRSLNFTSNTSIFDNSTLPPMEDSVLMLPESVEMVFPVDEMEEEKKVLKRRLEAWRSVFLVVMDFLLWEKKWYPIFLFGLNSSIFFVAFWMNFSFFSCVCILGCVLTAIDFVVPALAPLGLISSQWSETDEKRFDSVVWNILKVEKKIHFISVLVSGFRRDMPRTTSVGFALIFLLSAFFFAKINNFFSIYFLTTTLLLFPGMQKFGLLRAANDVAGRAKTFLMRSKTFFVELKRPVK